jgi:phage gpG-like protein
MPSKQINMNHFGDHLRTVLEKAPRVIGVMGVNHFKQSFQMQRFNDVGSQPWQPTASGKTSNILIGKQSGALRNSLQTEQADLAMIRWAAKRPYAKLHNEGGTVHPRVTPQMRKFAWAKYYEARNTTEKNKWRGLALTKKDKLTIRIPQRQFIGRSHAFETKINTWFTTQLDYR